MHINLSWNEVKIMIYFKEILHNNAVVFILYVLYSYA